ncbi:MAG: hypothetical protein R2853_11385 [Thermomicrobiales bacterium]
MVIITLIGAVPAAYSLTRLAGRWGEGLGMVIFLVYLVPPTLLFIPFRGWWPTWVCATPGGRWCWSTPASPSPLHPAADGVLQVDSARYRRAGDDRRLQPPQAIYTVLPVSIPGLLTVIVFSFALTMHEFVYALAFVTSYRLQKTISIGVTTELIRGDVFFWQSLMAAAALVAIPVALIYNVFLDRFIAGFTLGAVKG